MIVRDVALQTNGNIHNAPLEWSTIPASRYDLAPDLWVEKLPSKVFWEIYDHCEPEGKWRGAKPGKQFAQLYTFVREVSNATAMDLNWDRDNRLHTCIALSREVHPTTINYSAVPRVPYADAGTLLDIVPSP